MIEACLQSASKIADQLIVVDTGSTDQTPQIASACGAEVYHHPWENDFAKARNYSLNYATNDWILILDGDEVLDHQTIQHLPQLISQDPQVEAYQLEIINYTSDRLIEEEAGVIKQTRLFRNRPYYRYGGLVHNQLRDQRNQSQLVGSVLPIRVHHYGYTPSVWAAQQKNDRIVLHERAVADDPDNRFIRFNYGNHLKILDRHQEALEQFILSIPPVEETGVVEIDADGKRNISAELNWALSSCFLGAFCANRIENYQIALALTEEALTRAPDLVDASLRRAEALIELKRYQEVDQLLSRILTVDPPHVVKRRALFHDAPYRLGRARFLNNQFAEAAPPFASLLSRCDDITILIHLCLCLSINNLRSLWDYVRQRGTELNSDDPDWATVDQVATQRSHLPPLQLSPVILKAPHHPEWLRHLQKGLTYFGFDDLLSSQKESEGLSFEIKEDSTGRLKIEVNLNDEPILLFPERYPPVEIALPEESALLFITQIVALHQKAT